MNSLSLSVMLVILIFFPTSSSLAHGEGDDLGRLVFLTEEYPPANFMKNGELVGYSVDLLHAAAKEVGDNLDSGHMVLQTWSDAYRSALTSTNSVVFSTTRTEHREELFQWVGPIADVKVVVMARNGSNIQVNNPIDMAKYKIGVVKDDIGEQLLLDIGVPRAAMLEASDVVVLAELLTKKRIDLIAYSERTAYWYASQAGMNSELFKPIYTLKEGHTYYAFNKDSDPILVKKLQLGIDRVKEKTNENGVSQYQAILDKYR
ncbi:transporter substrate-binding domain-containing protein [Vibrio sp. ZSDE26]|uniref:Transporter substrate-binding domain-containing protein n=1 Tax=Vibrio amylolyticus TaxID=2847292 RepID=A0A9X2BHK2_9VIBR|nr:transporter substrate-binding domain-containing protein [Vibrio amylolyticus]MCK6263989.1 transporter substrate-binding domain-containing protein [Vibrio amylolyticus]